MSINNIYYVDMEQRFNDFRDGKIDMRALQCQEKSMLRDYS
jgi:hypothetical protein